MLTIGDFNSFWVFLGHPVELVIFFLTTDCTTTWFVYEFHQFNIRTDIG